MTVSSSTDRATFPGNGVAQVFPLPFRFFSEGDIQAWLVENDTGALTSLTLGVHYTLSGAGDPEVNGSATGQLTMLAPPSSLQTLFVQRNIPLTQPTDIVNQGRFFPEVHETVFDRLTMLIQQANGESKGAIRMAVGDPEPNRLAPAVSRANRLMGFDSQGNPVAVSPTSGDVSDFALDLANNTDPAKGAALVGYRGRTQRDKNEDTLSVRDFGAVGDGVTDDSAAIQAAIDYARTTYSATLGRFQVVLDFAGKSYRVESSINATLIRQPGFTMQNGGLYGACAGQIVLDLAGSNTVRIINFDIYGDETSTPSVGVLLAKAEISGNYPDAKQHKLINIRTNGNFTKAAMVNFASEVSEEVGCVWQNRSLATNAYCAIYCANADTLDAYIGGLTSLYATIPQSAQGTQSNILHECGNSQYMRAARVVQTITNITNASTAVVTVADGPGAAAQGLANGSKIFLYNIAGMTELNGLVYTVRSFNSVAGTFDLYNATDTAPIDSSGFGAFVSGTLFNQTGPAVLLSSVGDYDADGYFLTYGSPEIVWDAKNGGTSRQVSIRGQFEHSPDRCVRFDLPDAGTAVIQGLDVRFLNANQTVRSAFFGTNSAEGGLQINDFKLRISSATSTDGGVFASDSKFKIRQADFRLPINALWTDPTTLASFSGVVHIMDNDTRLEYVAGALPAALQMRAPPGVNQTGMVLLVNSNGTLITRSVQLGPLDSAGAGFQYLRVQQS